MALEWLKAKLGLTPDATEDQVENKVDDLLNSLNDAKENFISKEEFNEALNGVKQTVVEAVSQMDTSIKGEVADKISAITSSTEAKFKNFQSEVTKEVASIKTSSKIDETLNVDNAGIVAKVSEEQAEGNKAFAKAESVDDFLKSRMPYKK